MSDGAVGVAHSGRRGRAMTSNGEEQMTNDGLARGRAKLSMGVIAICIASLGLLATPKPASAFTGERSCACSNLEACPFQYQRLCCEWSGSSYSCSCSFYITNCVEDQ